MDGRKQSEEQAKTMNQYRQKINVACQRRDCVYANVDPFKLYGCSYAQMENKSKLSQIPPGEKYSIENCPFYKQGQGHKKRSVEAHPPTDKVDPAVLRGAQKLSREENTLMFYEMKLCDKDIAKIYDVPAQSVAHWRKVSGIGSGHETKRLNWREINNMMKDGYSDVAIARIVHTQASVITEYRKTEASHNQ